MELLEEIVGDSEERRLCYCLVTIAELPLALLCRANEAGLTYSTNRKSVFHKRRREELPVTCGGVTCARREREE